MLNDIAKYVDHLEKGFDIAKQGKYKSPPWIKHPKLRDSYVKTLANYPNAMSVLASALKVDGLQHLYLGKRFSELNTFLFSSCYKLYKMENKQATRSLTMLHAFSHVDGEPESFLTPKMFFTKTSLALDIGSMFNGRQFSSSEIEILRYFIVNRLEFLSHSYTVPFLEVLKSEGTNDATGLEKFYAILSEAVLLAFVLYVCSLFLPDSQKRLCKIKINHFLLPILRAFKDDLPYCSYLRESRSLVNSYTNSKQFFNRSVAGLDSLESIIPKHSSIKMFLELLSAIKPARFWKKSMSKDAVNSIFTSTIAVFIGEVLEDKLY